MITILYLTAVGLLAFVAMVAMTVWLASRGLDRWEAKERRHQQGERDVCSRKTRA